MSGFFLFVIMICAIHMCGWLGTTLKLFLCILALSVVVGILVGVWNGLNKLWEYICKNRKDFLKEGIALSVIVGIIFFLGYNAKFNTAGIRSESQITAEQMAEMDSIAIKSFKAKNYPKFEKYTDVEILEMLNEEILKDSYKINN